MGKYLFLLRHAKSSWKDSQISDFARPLNNRGRNNARSIGRYMNANKIIPDLILCSAALRATETLSMITKYLPNKIEPYFCLDLYMASEAIIIQKIMEIDVPADNLLLVGHNPGLETFFFNLNLVCHMNLNKQKIEKFPTGALAVFKTTAEDWSKFDKNTTVLQEFVTPRALSDIA